MKAWTFDARVRKHNAIGITYGATFTIESDIEPSKGEMIDHIATKGFDTWCILNKDWEK
jgi:hypothetical protein